MKTVSIKRPRAVMKTVSMDSNGLDLNVRRSCSRTSSRGLTQDMMIGEGCDWNKKGKQRRTAACADNVDNVCDKIPI